MAEPRPSSRPTSRPTSRLATPRLTDALQGHLAMLVFAALVAGSYSVGALAANEIAPTALSAARFLLAAVLMLALAPLIGRPLRRAHLAAPWRYGLLGALFAIYFVLMFEALKTAPPVSTAAVFTLTPLMAAGLGWLLLRQRLTGRMAVALSIGGVGALWVVFRADLAALLAFEVGRGETLFFFGCLAHAALPPVLRRLDRGEPQVVSNGLVMVGGCVVLMVAAWREILATDWLNLPAIVWITLAYLAVVTTALSFFLLQFAGRRIPAAKVMAYTYLVPSFVILWELALGNPPPPGLILPGIGLSILALLLLLKDEGEHTPFRAAG